MSSDLRSSKQQFQDELDEAYRKLTDPAEIAKEALRAKREQRIKNAKLDYGL